VLAAARRLGGRGVVAIDAALGMPKGYLERLWACAAEWRDVNGFLPWLHRAAATPGFFVESRSAADWRYDRPFIAVPGGAGSLDTFWARTGGPLLRGVEKDTGAKSLFIVSGIPGTVGSGTRALLQELAPLLRPGRDFGIWPFEGPLPVLLGRHGIVVAEIYPRVCYALALDEELPAPLRLIDKTKAEPRADATRCLLQAPWLARGGVTIHDADPDSIDEDDFDAIVSAAGLLRCALERLPLERGDTDVVEGAILGMASLDLTRPAARGCGANLAGANLSPARARRQPLRSSTTNGVGRLDYPCPIPGCSHVFCGSRGGWDPHVAAVRRHPNWHPEIRDAEGRKKAFRAEFPGWF
jgi:hypothetical protein